MDIGLTNEDISLIKSCLNHYKHQIEQSNDQEYADKLKQIDKIEKLAQKLSKKK